MDEQTRTKLESLERTLRQQPANSAMLVEFASLCGVSGEVEWEERVFRDLVTQAPQNAMLLAHWAQALGDIGEFDLSIETYERAMAIAPHSHEIHVSYGMSLLRRGDFVRGWEHYEHRELMPQLAQFSRPITQPRYAGGNLHGRTILLLGEQGLGDTLMTARYAPLLAARGARVTMVVQSEIAELIRSVRGVSQVVRFGDSPPVFHTHARLLNLPRTFNAIPEKVPYLRVPDQRINRWRERLAADGVGRRIGLVWAGNPKHTRDAHRSMHLSDFAPLADVPNTIFYSLQKGPREDESQDPPKGMRFINLSPQIQDFSDLAGLLHALDLLICVDTAPAHLAGALGLPIWTLLPYSPDWRWMLNRADSPWYPTMRLFRQPKLRDWASMITQVRDALHTGSNS